MRISRLYVDDALEPGAALELSGARAHYLGNVMRLRAGATVRVFNARSGEHAAIIGTIGRHRATIEVGERLRAPETLEGPVLHVAPIRQNRFDWLIEKACELGVARVQPVLTRHTVVKLGKLDRVRAIAVEAAEQCGRLSVPRIDEPMSLATWLATWLEEERPSTMFADERGDAPSVQAAARHHPSPSILIGPEGGFEDEERAALRAHPAILPVSLGPRILRTETAALVALALLSATVPLSTGDRALA